MAKTKAAVEERVITPHYNSASAKGSASPSYAINYDDERFQQVESEKQAAMDNMNNTYNDMIGSSDQYYQQQIDAAKEWSETQQQLQQENTDFAIEQINQQKDKAEQDYLKEQSGAYVDWQKQSGKYGAEAEQMASQGLTNTGFSESSQVSMYNTYQNRVATARESYNNAVLNYDNAIKDAQLQNNSKLAEIAYQALQTELELSLEGFQYKNELLTEQMNRQMEYDEMYYNRYQDVLAQMNQENALAEEVRQYNESMAEDKRQFNENMALQKKQLDEEIRQYNQSYNLQVKQFNEEIRQFDAEIARLKAKDTQEAKEAAKQLELQKKQLEEQKRQADMEYKLQTAQLEEEKRQFDKQYTASYSSSRSSGGGGGSSSSGSGSGRQTIQNPKKVTNPKKSGGGGSSNKGSGAGRKTSSKNKSTKKSNSLIDKINEWAKSASKKKASNKKKSTSKKAKGKTNPRLKYQIGKR